MPFQPLVVTNYETNVVIWSMYNNKSLLVPFITLSLICGVKDKQMD